MTQKDAIRTAVLARRDALPLRLRADKSAAICREVEEALMLALVPALAPALVPALAATVGARTPLIAAYAAMRSEVDLRSLIQSARAHGWDICFPCMIQARPDAPTSRVPSMAFFRVSHDKLDTDEAEFLTHPLRLHTAGDLERRGFLPVQPTEIDAMVVPLVAFDDEGNRLGYGQGNYDRYLGLLRPDALVMGVAFDEQKIDAVPREPHDRPLPRIVSA